MRVPHPIPYQGSKRRLAPTILACFPRDTARVIEPFAGSAAVSLAAATAGIGQRFVLNDANAPLIALWQAILTDPPTLADQYAALWQAQIGDEAAAYDRVRAAFNREPAPHLLLFLLARCVKAAVRYNARGEFNQSADHRRRGMQPATMRRHLIAASDLLASRATLMCADFRAVLSHATPADVVYFDPPYQGVCHQRDPRYLAQVAVADLIDAFDQLNRRGIAYVVSYDGRTGSKTFGDPLPPELGLQRYEIDAGRSSQATLLQRSARTYESLYLSPVLIERLQRSASATVDHIFGKMGAHTDVP
jgi:DNA adenine methylase